MIRSEEGRGREAEPRSRRRWPWLLGGLAVGMFVIWFVVIPYPRGLEAGDPGPTALMEQRVREAREAGDSLSIQRAWVDLGEISPNMRRAVVVAEDYRFREHGGVDWVSLAEEVEWTGDEDFSWLSARDLLALARAVSHAWENRAELRGRSTITQQLAKNLYFGTDRSFVRKAMELVVARRLERSLDKDRILELYLNAAEWGPGVFGVEMAARRYFGRSAADLTLAQSAALAGTLPHPLTSNPAYRPGRMEWRRDLILSRLAPSGRSVPGPIPEPPPDLVLPDSLAGVPLDWGDEGTGAGEEPDADSLSPDTVFPAPVPGDSTGVPGSPPGAGPGDALVLVGRGALASDSGRLYRRSSTDPHPATPPHIP